MAGGFEVDEVDVDEYEGTEETQIAGHRRTRRRRRHGSRKCKEVAMVHGLPPGVFVVNSSDEDAAAYTGVPERTVVVWGDLLGGLATKPSGTSESSGDVPRTKVPMQLPQVNSATVVWPSREQKEAQWCSSWSTGPTLPTPVQAEQVPTFDFHPLTVQVPQQPMQLGILATSPYINNVRPTCSGFEQQAVGPPTQTSCQQWSHADSDMMRQLLFSNAGYKVPSRAELLAQLQAVAPQSYED